MACLARAAIRHVYRRLSLTVSGKDRLLNWQPCHAIQQDEITSAMLLRCDLTVQLANNGAEAVAMCEKEHFAGILMDWCTKFFRSPLAV
jgi:hypothetical protein